MARRSPTCEEPWVSLCSELVSYLSTCLKQVEEELVLVKRNCENCHQFLRQYKADEPCEEAGDVESSESIAEVNGKLQNELVKAEAVLSEARALRQGKARTKKSVRPTQDQKKPTREDSKDFGDCNGRSGAATLAKVATEGRPRRRSRSLAPRILGVEVAADRKRTRSTSRHQGDRGRQNAVSALKNATSRSEDSKKDYTTITVPAALRESYREFEKEAFAARDAAKEPVSGRSRFLKLLEDEGGPDEVPDKVRFVMASNAEVDQGQSTKGKNVTKCPLTAVPNPAKYSSVGELQELADQIASAKEVLLRSHLVHVCDRDAVTVLREADRNDRDFVTLFRCLYGIVAEDGRSFPVFARNDDD